MGRLTDVRLRHTMGRNSPAVDIQLLAKPVRPTEDNCFHISLETLQQTGGMAVKNYHAEIGANSHPLGRTGVKAEHRVKRAPSDKTCDERHQTYVRPWRLRTDECER